MKISKICLIMLLSLSITNIYAQAINRDGQGNNVNLDDLTDSDRHLSETFIHEGLTQRTKEELCNADADTKKACMGMEAEKKFLGLSPTLIQGVAKAYTMIIGSGGLGNGFETDATATDSNSADSASGTDTTGDTAATETETTPDTENPEADSDSGEAKDYCRYIPVATETVATFQQTSEQQNLQNLPTNQASAQKEALYKVEQSHRSRADTSKIQRTGWMGSTGCYAAYMATGFQGVSKTSKSNLLKLGASALLWKFFDSQVGAHKDYADRVRNVADKLPGTGDCNPITDVNCYCAQEETMYDPKYCREIYNKNKIASTSIAVSCIDDKMKADPACKCKASNTCFDQQFMTNVSGFNFGNMAEKGAISPFMSMTNGELKNGKLSNASSKQFAIVNKALKDSSTKLGNLDKPLTKSQKEEAKALIDAFGLSKNLASHIASKPVNSSVTKAVSKLSSGSTNKAYRKSNYKGHKGNTGKKVLRFSGGGGINKASKSSGSNPFSVKKRRSKKSSGKILKYAQRAQESAAQITKNKDRPIFDIISRRYQVSGWRRLELKR
jgi:hypothetical protein